MCIFESGDCPARKRPLYSGTNPDLVPGFSILWLVELVQNLVLMATQWLHGAEIKRACYRFSSKLFNVYMGWLMGLEPTTTGITILKNMYLPLLNGVGTININQQLT